MTDPTPDLDKIKLTILHAREDAEGWYNEARPLVGRQHFAFAGAGRMLNNTANAAEQLLNALAAERARADQAQQDADAHARDAQFERDGRRKAEQRIAAVLRGAAVVAYKGPEDTDTALLRTAARNLDRGFPLGGGNLTRTVVNVLRAVAAILDDANSAPTAGQGADQ